MSDNSCFEIVVFKQKINKEDKKSYDLLRTKSFLNGQETVKKTNINTFNYITSVLANTDVIDVHLKLSDLNFKSDVLDGESFIDGIFKVVSICITDNGVYKSAYILKKKSGLLVHYQVKANSIVIDKDGTIVF